MTNSGASSSAIEREAKLVAPADLVVPGLDGVLDGISTRTLAPLHLEATYFDTADLALARTGVTLRHRTGEPGAEWTLKLPDVGVSDMLRRRELEFDGPPGSVPDAVIDLVQATVRTRTVDAVARLTTARSPVELLDADGQHLATVVDDRVTVTQGGAAVGEFREIEIEMHDDSRTARRAMRAAIDRLTAAGASAEAPMPKLVRALGPRAQAPPDVVVAKLAKAPTMTDVVRHAIARSLAQIQRHDPAVRLGDDPEDVHQLRVATRRLRSDLRTFRDILERNQVDRVRAELKWVGTQVGAVRDNDVLRQRITDASIELPEVDKGEAAHLLGHLEVQGKAARTEMLAALRNPRYVSLLDALVDLADTPPFITDTVTTKKMAANRAARFVRRPWRRLASAVAALDADPSDADLHQVRIRAKRCRYAAEAVAPIIGTQAERFAEAVADIQTVLGDHQDTVVAQTWLRAAARAVPFAGVAAGQLVAGERTRRGNLRRQWPKTWKKASASNLRRWL